MKGISKSIEEFEAAARSHHVHTIELATPDTYGHIRGKRVPVERFFNRVQHSGAAMADVIYVLDMRDDLPDNEFINMDTGYADCDLVVDKGTGRVLTHRPGYGLIFADAIDANGEPHQLAPRAVLAKQVERCRDAGLDPVVATEMEFYLCHQDRQRVQEHIQYSSLTDAMELEPVLSEMRDALLGAGIEVESSNAEYGPGQIEVNAGHCDAMTAADNATLFKSIIKQVAGQHGLLATFMPKPWTEHSGSGMHVHTSLNNNGSNAFSDCERGVPNDLMRHWLGGILEHAAALTMLGAPTPNGPKRIRPYTFAPTHINWGLDNRTVLARCITEPGSAANRVEFRLPGTDANPYLIIAGLLAAGSDGVERSLDPGTLSEGDLYTNPGDSVALPTTLREAVDAYADSALAAQLGDMFSRSFISMAEAELALAAKHNPEVDDVNDWERDRFFEHS